MNPIVLSIIRAIIFPFTLIKHCKSSCCEFDCDTVNNNDNDIDTINIPVPSLHPSPRPSPRPSPEIERKMIII
jgi:hypothetical protein